MKVTHTQHSTYSFRRVGDVSEVQQDSPRALQQLFLSQPVSQKTGIEVQNSPYKQASAFRATSSQDCSIFKRDTPLQDRMEHNDGKTRLHIRSYLAIRGSSFPLDAAHFIYGETKGRRPSRCPQQLRPAGGCPGMETSILSFPAAGSSRSSSQGSQHCLSVSVPGPGDIPAKAVPTHTMAPVDIQWEPRCGGKCFPTWGEKHGACLQNLRL